MRTAKRAIKTHDGILVSGTGASSHVQSAPVVSHIPGGAAHASGGVTKR